MEDVFKSFVISADQVKIEDLISKLELEEDRELEEIIMCLSSIII